MEYAIRLTLASASPAPFYTGGFWNVGVAKLTGGSRIADWVSGYLIQVDPIGEKVDVSQHGNYAMLEDIGITISADGMAAFSAAGASLQNATVEVGTISGGTFSVKWTGAVVSAPWSGPEVAIRAESMATRRHRQIPVQILSAETSPTISEESNGKPVPIIWGQVERMRPPVLQSDDLPEVGIRVRTGVSEYLDSDTTCLMLGDFDEGPIPDIATSTTAVLYYSIMLGGDYGTGNAGTWAYTAIDGATGGTPTHDMYVEVFSGTGSGQKRAISNLSRITRSNFSINPPGAYEGSVVTILTPWDTIPDETSSFRVYKIDRLASYAVADQGASAIVSDADSGVLLATDTTQTGTILVADLSSEFASGEDVIALRKVTNTSTYGFPNLSDGITTSGATQIGGSAWQRYSIPDGVYYRDYDVMCTARTDYTKLIGAKELYLIASVETFPGNFGGNPRPHAFAIAVDFTGKKTVLTPIFDPSTTYFGNDVNAFSPSLAEDGSRLNFRTYGYKIPMIVPVSAIQYIDFGVICPAFYGVNNYVDLTGAGEYRVTTVTKSGSNVLTNTGGVAPLSGDYIRPAKDFPGALAYQITDYISGIPVYGSFVPAGYWQAVESFSGTSSITIANASAWPDGSYTVIMDSETGPPNYAMAREICLAASYGTVALTETAVSVEHGREYTSPWDSPPLGAVLGDPITDAREAAINMIRRDLGDSSGVDTASFRVMPSEVIRAVIGDRRSSADILAQMCQEYGWIGSHDSTGRETAVSFMPQVGSASYAYDVTNAEIVSGSFTGLEQTSMEDLITLPTISRSWTQIDGYRLTAKVFDLSSDPSTVNTGNIDQYATGFDSKTQAVEAYGILYDAKAISGIEQDGEINLQFTDRVDALVIDSGRLRWAALRKDIATFCVADTHAAAFAILGKRVRVAHRRYIKTARIGTLVARYWYPDRAQVQLTVMLDP